MNNNTWIGFRAFDSEKRTIIQTGNFPVFMSPSGYRWVMATFDKKIYMVPIKCVAFKNPFDEKPVLVPLHELMMNENAQTLLEWMLEGPDEPVDLADEKWYWLNDGTISGIIERQPQRDIPPQFSHIPVLDVSGKALGYQEADCEDSFIQFQG